MHLDTTATRAPHAWVHGTNANLPGDTRVQWALQVGGEFHARFSARARTYRYVIFNRRIRPALHPGRVTWDYRPLDTERTQAGADPLPGEHDFSGYRARACPARSAGRTFSWLHVRPTASARPLAGADSQRARRRRTRSPVSAARTKTSS